jgi:hypothetical protein
MATCPDGHPSTDDEYCDTCGLPIGAAVSTPASPSPAPASAESCPVCQAPRAGQFCEDCGHDFTASAPLPTAGPPGPVPARWEAVAGADRVHFDRVVAEGGPDAAGLVFPPYCPERSFALSGAQVRIGRHSRSRDSAPEIDLSGPPQDPGVSHLHAVLLAQADGGWNLVDPGSANGTLVNDQTVKVNVPVAVRAGDRIHVGAWTVITLRESLP